MRSLSELSDVWREISIIARSNITLLFHRCHDDMWIYLLLLLCSTLTNSKKLYCQHGRQHNDVTTAGLGFLLTTTTKRSTSSDDILCCGKKPFNSQLKICCFGEIISRTTMRCCPDGSFLPKESVCRCHPPSTWVMNQIKKMNQLQRKHLHLIEELSTLISKTKSRLDDLQDDIKLMDEQAQNLYDIFLQMIKIDRTETNEAEHVIEMIKFRNSLEGEGGNIEWNSSQPQSKIRRDTDDVLHDDVMDGIEMIVMKRDEILRELSPLYWQVTSLHRILEREEEISSIVTNDRHLMGTFSQIFDDLMTLVIRMEISLKQEYPEHEFDEVISLEDSRMELRRRLIEDPLSTSSTTNRRDHIVTSSSTCNFLAWTSYLETYEARIWAIISDIRLLKRAFATDRYSQAADTNTSAQLKRISSTNFLVDRYYRRF